MDAYAANRREEVGLNGRVSVIIIVVLCACGHIVRAEERQSGKLATEAAAAIRAGNVRSGISLLRAAIKSDESRERFSSLDTRQAVTPAALAHGREQFRQLSQNRPKLLEYSEVAGFNKLAQWATRKFAGEGLGFLVDWRNGPPRGGWQGSLAISARPHGRVRAYIGIAEFYSAGPQVGQPLSSEVLWKALVFELINRSNSEAELNLAEQALAGDISKVDYVIETFRLEHRAVQLTQEFYCNHYLPWAHAENVPTDPKIWFVANSKWWGTANEALEQFPFSSDYPWKFYGDNFSSIRRHANARSKKPASQIEQTPSQLAK